MAEWRGRGVLRQTDTQKKNEYEVRGLMRGTDCTGPCEPCEDLDNSFFFWWTSSFFETGSHSVV